MIHAYVSFLVEKLIKAYVKLKEQKWMSVPFLRKVLTIEPMSWVLEILDTLGVQSECPLRMSSDQETQRDIHEIMLGHILLVVLILFSCV